MLSFSPAKRDHRDARKSGSIGGRESGSIGERRNSRREGIAVEIPTELCIPALRHLIAAPVPCWPHRAAGKAVVGRIAVEYECAGPGLLCRVHLYGAMTAPVARDGDAPLRAYAEPHELLEVGRKTVVHVHHLTLHLARSRVGDKAFTQLWV